LEKLPEFAIPPWDPEAAPVGTGLHQIYPTFSRMIYISAWTDTDGSGTLTVSDQMTIMYMDDYSTYEVHVTGISTDIHISQKPIPPVPPPITEFPLGIEMLMMLAPLIPIVYLWRRKGWKK